jgi:hypothetical protein
VFDVHNECLSQNVDGEMETVDEFDVCDVDYDDEPNYSRYGMLLTWECLCLKLQNKSGKIWC